MNMFVCTKSLIKDYTVLCHLMSYIVYALFICHTCSSYHCLFLTPLQLILQIIFYCTVLCTRILKKKNNHVKDLYCFNVSVM